MKKIVVLVGFFASFFFIFNYYIFYLCKSEYNYNYSPSPLLSTRNDLVTILRDEGLQTGAEIGVQTGIYAEHLLNNWSTCTEYHAIDLWQTQKHYVDHANVDNSKQEENYRIALLRLKQWKNIVKYHRNYSNLAVHDIQDNSLDFIYIDARHDYSGVSEDLVLYWPKLKRGGIFAGHDFLDAGEVTGQDWYVDSNGNRKADGKAVKSAVIEFALKHKRQLLRTLNEEWPTWYFRK